MSAPRVYVIHQPKPRPNGYCPELGGAQEYGTLEYVFDLDDRANTSPQTAVMQAGDRLRDFDPERDFLCWAGFGDPATLWVTIAVLTAMGHTRLRWLYWSKSRERWQADGNSTEPQGYYAPLAIDVSIVAEVFQQTN